MKNIYSLLTAQLVAAALLIAVLLFSFLGSSKQLIEQQDTQAKHIIENILANHITSDGKTLSRQLDRSFSLQSLQVSRLDGTMLYEQQQATSGSLISSLLSATGYTPATIQLRDEQQDIQVKAILNHQNLLSEQQSFLLLLLLIPLLVTVVPVLWLKFSIQRQYQAASDKVVQTIERFLDKDRVPQTQQVALPADFVDIEHALQKLANFHQLQLAQMTAAAQEIAEEAYKDQVTGLPNRNRFVQTYEEQYANAANGSGIFAITRCTELQSLNQSRGFQEGDQYIREVAEILKRVAANYVDSKLFRLNSSDFGILLPGVSAKESENFTAQLQARFNEYQKLAELDSVAYTGLVCYEPGKVLGELLATADTSISLAQTKQPNAWHLQKDDDGVDNSSNGFGNQNWRNVIDEVLENNRLTLLVQTIQPSSRAAYAYAEILVRFNTQENQPLPTASFLAMAEKLDKIIAVDRQIIETALATIKNRNMQDQYFGINLSQRSVHDDQFVIWLERRLLRDANMASKLVFEVSEFGMQQNLKTSKRFIDMVHRAGARVTVEKFGIGITSFKFFRDLKPDFVKMDGSYTRHIDDDKNNQYFMRLMIDLAHRIGVGVFAESVETQEEKHMLESMFIDGNQGYYIGKPVPM